MQITTNDIITFFSILTLGMTVILLYHGIIIALNMRRVVRRVDRVTKEVESVVMKPLLVADSALAWVTSFFQGLYGEHDTKSNIKKHAHDANHS